MHIYKYLLKRYYHVGLECFWRKGDLSGQRTLKIKKPDEEQRIINKDINRILNITLQTKGNWETPQLSGLIINRVISLYHE